jgi:hypothetical protein
LYCMLCTSDDGNHMGQPCAIHRRIINQSASNKDIKVTEIIL